MYVPSSVLYAYCPVPVSTILIDGLFIFVVSMALAIFWSDSWKLSFKVTLTTSHLQSWILKPDSWFLIPDSWFLTPETWLLKPDSWNLKILPVFKLFLYPSCLSCDPEPTPGYRALYQTVRGNPAKCNRQPFTAESWLLSPESFFPTFF